MAKMQTRTRHVPLDFVGDEWAEAYIEFRRGHWSDTEVIEEINKTNKGTRGLVEMLKHMFHSGKMVDESGSLVDMTKENIAEFDNDALVELADKLYEGADPKVSENSTPTSEELDPSPTDSVASSTESDLV